MTTLDRLNAWKAAGTITDAQHLTLTALVRKERVSVYVELSALLYIGVLSFVGGLIWTFRAYVADLGDAAILSFMSLLVAATFYYCFTRAEPYANTEAESPNLAMDYVLYLGCLVLSAEIGYIEYRFHIFDNWHHHLLIASVVFGGLAYRFDNRFVLSLALSSLAGWLGLRISGLTLVSADPLRATALLYAAFVAGIGTWLHRQQIKAHFLEVYLHLATNVVLAALASGIGEPAMGLAYLAGLLSLCGAAIVLGVRYRRFAFVLYGTLYGYGGISFKVLESIGGVTAHFLYLFVTGSLVLIALVVLARRFGRDE
ncbi:MAG: DUF2157 domain-containing protein [Vicinamibacterales bacterium]